MKRILYISLGILLLLASCELEERLDTQLPAGDPIPIVEAYLQEGAPYQILLFESNNLQEEVRINTLWNARVWVIHGSDSIRLRNIIRIGEYGFFYNYISDSIVKPKTGNYRLLIEGAADESLQASCQALPQVQIDQASLLPDRIQLSTTNTGTAHHNYYLLRSYLYSEGNIESYYQTVYDFHLQAEGQVEISAPVQESPGDSVLLELFRLDSTAYVYHRRVGNAINANRDPFASPVPIEGNISHAWGIFTYTCRDQRMLYPE